MSTAWVVSGGGMKGCIEVGMMKALHEAKERPIAIYGTSTGALNGAGYAYGGIKELEDMWLSLKKRKHVFGTNTWKLLWMDGYYNLKPLRKKLMKIITESRFENTDLFTPEAFPIYVHLKTLKVLRGHPHDLYDDYIDAVIASASIPAVMSPVNTFLADGGVIDQIPLRQAIKDGHDRIHVLLASPKNPVHAEDWKPKFPKLVHYALRAIEGLKEEVWANDLKACIHNNKKTKIIVHAPTEHIIGSLDFDNMHEKIKRGISHGYARVQAKLGTHTQV